MGRPCEARHPTPIPDKCGMCWAALNRPSAQAAWNLPVVDNSAKRILSIANRRSAQAKQASPFQPFPNMRPRKCLYELDVVEPCKSCNSIMRELRHVRGCRKHGKCVRDHRAFGSGNLADGVECCHCCDDFNDGTGKDVVARFTHEGLALAKGRYRFNPSIAEWKDGYVLAWRDGWKGSNVWISVLDSNFRETGQHVKLGLARAVVASWGCEDPRLFWYQGRLHVSYTGVVGWKGPTNILYARLRDDLTAERPMMPRNEGYQRRSWEKNWGFFEHDGQLYASYCFNPHRVLRIEGEAATIAYETDSKFHWRGGEEARGGAAPVLVGDEWWCFFHSRVEHERGVSGSRVYNMGLLTFDAQPPFAIRRMIEEPICIADPATNTSENLWGDKNYCPVVFPGGAIRRGDDWIIAMGLHDRYTELRRFNHADLDRRLRPFGDGENDPLLDRAKIVNHDEAKSPAWIERHRTALGRMLEAKLPDYSGPESGDGVILAGGGKYWAGNVVAVKLLRQFSNLPIEIWHRGDDEPVNPADLAGVEGVEIIDALKTSLARRRLETWEIKAYALMQTKFRYAAWLDADAYFVRNPEPLFEELRFWWFMYWQDVPEYETTIRWDTLGIDGAGRIPNVQAGQMFIDRKACWRELQICHWANQHSDFFYNRDVAGFADQDIWRAVWTATRRRYRCLGEATEKKEPHRVFVCSHDGDPYVVHRTQAKMFKGEERRTDPSLPMESEAWAIFDSLR